MDPHADQIIRTKSLVDRTKELVKAKLEGGQGGLSDVLLSERELAKSCGVSRTTVRQALRRLIAEGYLVSLPRRGYQVTSGEPPRTAGGLVAFVHGTPKMPWTWTGYQMRILEEFQRAAAGAGLDPLVVALEHSTPEEVGRRLAARGVSGAVVDADDPAVALAVRSAGLPAVLIDMADPAIDSVTMDNVGGAHVATEALIARAHRRIAFVGYEVSAGSGSLHLRERLAGYLAALAGAGLAAPEEWRIVARPGDAPGRMLMELFGREGGPTAAAVLWPEVLPDVGAALAAAPARPDLVVWWGGAPRSREDWAERCPQLPIPDGMSWDVGEMVRKALSRLERLRAAGAGDGRPSRTLVAVDLVPGEAPRRRREA